MISRIPENRGSNRSIDIKGEKKKKIKKTNRNKIERIDIGRIVNA